MRTRFNFSKLPFLILAQAFACLLTPTLSVAAPGNHFIDCNQMGKHHKKDCLYGTEIIAALNEPTGRSIQVMGTNFLIGRCVDDEPLEFNSKLRHYFRPTPSHVVGVLKVVDGSNRFVAFNSPTSIHGEAGKLEDAEAYISVPANQEKLSEKAKQSLIKQILDENSDPSKISYVQTQESSGLDTQWYLLRQSSEGVFYFMNAKVKGSKKITNYCRLKIVGS